MTEFRQRWRRFRPATLLWLAGLSIGIVAGAALAIGLAAPTPARLSEPVIQ